MTREYRITTDNIHPESDMDCVLSPDDSIREIQRLQYLGGLGARYHPVSDTGSNISVTGDEKGQLMKQNDIQPGTPEWFQLWFSLPYLTGEKPIK